MSIGPSHDEKYLEESDAMDDDGWIGDGGNDPEIPRALTNAKAEPRRKQGSRKAIEDYWETKRLRHQLDDIYLDDTD